MGTHDDGPPEAAAKLDEFMRARGIGNRTVAGRLGVSHTIVKRWRAGEVTPDEDNQVKIEVFCAKVDAQTGATLFRDGGRVESHCPKELWRREGGPPPKPVQPYDAASATPEAAPCAT